MKLCPKQKRSDAEDKQQHVQASFEDLKKMHGTSYTSPQYCFWAGPKNITELTPKDIQQIKYLLASMKLVPSVKRILSTRSRHPGSHGIMLTCQLANFQCLLAFEFVYTIYTCIYMLLSNGAHNDSKQEGSLSTFKLSFIHYVLPFIA